MWQILYLLHLEDWTHDNYWMDSVKKTVVIHWGPYPLALVGWVCQDHYKFHWTQSILNHTNRQCSHLLETLKDTSLTIASAFCWLTDEILLLRLGWSDLTDEEASSILDAQIDGDDICLCNNFLYHGCFFHNCVQGLTMIDLYSCCNRPCPQYESFHPVQLVLSPITISSRRRTAVEEVSMRKLQETLGTTSLQCIHASHLALYFFGNRERPWFCAIWVVPA